TLYTMEARTELIKNYRLVPDEKGNVKAYKQFWKQDDATTNVVNPLLVYADLIITGDRRCLDTAKKVYDEYLQDKF
ncbi:MAG TPA: type IV toxin-antitoxin system AbiEi family antitoxin, partial [Niabella sp.]|nr:type IV toxin-antitoxin system AbiEi family antitoxin [Niabella sp.]